MKSSQLRAAPVLTTVRRLRPEFPVKEPRPTVAASRSVARILRDFSILTAGPRHPTGGAAAREVDPVSTLTARKGWVMEKYMCYGALGVAAVMFLLFLLDLLAGFPFGGGSFMLADIFGLLASA